MERQAELLDQVKRLAGYYRDVIAASSGRRGGHLFDLASASAGAIVADVSPFFASWEALLDPEVLELSLPEVSPDAVKDIVSKATEQKEAELADNGSTAGNASPVNPSSEKEKAAKNVCQDLLG